VGACKFVVSAPISKGEIVFTFGLQSHCMFFAPNIAFFFPCMVIIGFSCELAGLMDLILCFICSRAVIAVDLWPWNYETRLGRVLHSSLYLTFHLPCFI